MAVFIVLLPPPSDGHPRRSLTGPAVSNLRNNSPLRSDMLTSRNVHHGGRPSAERKSEGSLRPRMMER
ncbi:hypothetical protein J6590_072359 [Homalodisca vitripennis]|nr:hypothetical protein J6590_072359 [Homalodisca vitripennis]